MACLVFIDLSSLLAEGLHNYISCLAGASIFGTVHLQIG